MNGHRAADCGKKKADIAKGVWHSAGSEPRPYQEQPPKGGGQGYKRRGKGSKGYSKGYGKGSQGGLSWMDEQPQRWGASPSWDGVSGAGGNGWRVSGVFSSECGVFSSKPFGSVGKGYTDDEGYKTVDKGAAPWENVSEHVTDAANRFGPLEVS